MFFIRSRLRNNKHLKYAWECMKELMNKKEEDFKQVWDKNGYYSEQDFIDSGKYKVEITEYGVALITPKQEENEKL